ncbi:MAG: RNA degradosome polyphosphate kinase, partial [Ignavibacteriales bacterium]|nr:RNA degradosome polyphosphate kinase [Ignavibacteriales bacterium]
KLYTDIGMLTADEDICADVSDVFNYLTGYSGQTEFRKLLVAPVTFRDRIIEKIFREIAHKKAGKEARVKIKMNSLVDPAVIAAFYEASRAGVKIDLNVRGICCLKPGVEGLSENIRVVSVVGRFLEHSRIFYFLNGGDEEVYIGSADLMPRNLDRRVETAAPVQDPRLKRYLADVVLDVMLRDNRKARELTSDGTYRRVEPGENERPINSQEWLMANADDFSIEETPPRTVAKT